MTAGDGGHAKHNIRWRITAHFKGADGLEVDGPRNSVLAVEVLTVAITCKASSSQPVAQRPSPNAMGDQHYTGNQDQSVYAGLSVAAAEGWRHPWVPGPARWTQSTAPCGTSLCGRSLGVRAGDPIKR